MKITTIVLNPHNKLLNEGIIIQKLYKLGLDPFKEGEKIDYNNVKDGEIIQGKLKLKIKYKNI